MGHRGDPQYTYITSTLAETVNQGTVRHYQHGEGTDSYTCTCILQRYYGNDYIYNITDENDDANLENNHMVDVAGVYLVSTDVHNFYLQAHSSVRYVYMRESVYANK